MSDYTNQINALSDEEKNLLLEVLFEITYIDRDDIHCGSFEDAKIVSKGHKEYDIFKKVFTKPKDFGEIKEEILALSHCYDSSDGYFPQIIFTLKVKNPLVLSEDEKDLIKEKAFEFTELSDLQLNELFEKKETRFNGGYGFFSLGPLAFYDFKKELK